MSFLPKKNTVVNIFTIVHFQCQLLGQCEVCVSQRRVMLFNILSMLLNWRTLIGGQKCNLASKHKRSQILVRMILKLRSKTNS